MQRNQSFVRKNAVNP